MFITFLFKMYIDSLLETKILKQTKMNGLSLDRKVKKRCKSAK